MSTESIDFDSQWIVVTPHDSVYEDIKRARLLVYRQLDIHKTHHCQVKRRRSFSELMGQEPLIWEKPTIYLIDSRLLEPDIKEDSLLSEAEITARLAAIWMSLPQTSSLLFFMVSKENKPTPLNGKIFSTFSNLSNPPYLMKVLSREHFRNKEKKIALNHWDAMALVAISLGFLRSNYAQHWSQYASHNLEITDKISNSEVA